MAVKILIKRRFKEGSMKAASRFIINTRTGAMKQPGYIASENLRNLNDKDQIVVVSMWENIEAWEAWKNSDERKAYVDEFREYYVGDAEYEYYGLGLQAE